MLAGSVFAFTFPPDSDTRKPGVEDDDDSIL